MGRLYLIPTPIGNPGDITQRALDLLGRLPLVACEDTRTTRRLLAEHDLPAPPLLSFTEYNKTRRTGELIERLGEGDVGLVSEAGMPGISDPGQELVAAAIEAGHEVVALPGPAAPLSALAASGLPTRRFLFLGFLPRSSGQRRAALGKVANLDATLIIFESPRRVRATLADVQAALGDRLMAVAREISKVHEEFIRGRVSEVLRRLENPRGEFTLVIDGQHEKLAVSEADAAAAARSLAASDNTSTKDIAAQLQDEFGLSHRRAYQIASEAREAGASQR